MNFLLITCDQLRYDAIQCNGNPYVETPNLNRLAERSVRFHQAFCAAPICSPSRHSLLTGKYPFAHGVVHNGIAPQQPLNDVGHELGKAGYRSLNTGAIPHRLNPSLSFETISPPNLEDLLSEEQKAAMEWEDKNKRHHAGASNRPKELHKGYLSLQTAIAALEQTAASGQPFQYWIGFHEPHPPFFPPRPYFDKFETITFEMPDSVPEDAPPPHPYIQDRKKIWQDMTPEQIRQMTAGYYGLVEMADTFVGMLLDTLDRLGLTDNTMIILTADHGEQLGDHGLFLKFVLRDPSVHVPLMISHPSLTPGDRHELVSGVDLFPTICDYAGVEAPADLHGYSLRPLLENKGSWPRQDVLAQFNQHIMLRTKEWKLNVYDGELGELYRLSDDPKEHYNLIGNPEYAGVAEQLHQRMQELLSMK